MMMTFECGLPSRDLATLGVRRRGDDGGGPSDPMGAGSLEDPGMGWSSSRLWIAPSLLPGVDRLRISTV
jgi:hypothetical protein